jgi:hypothetical protein
MNNKVVTTVKEDKTKQFSYTGYLSEYDVQTGVFTDKLALTDRVAFGACFTGGKLYIGKNQGIEVYNSSYSLVESLVIPPEIQARNLHQMVEHNGKIYITNTPYDSIIILDLATKTFTEFKVTNSGSNTKNVNSIYFKDDLMYIMCHNKGPSEIRVYNSSMQLQNTIANTGVMSHNIWEMNGDMWYCNSMEQKIQSVGGLYKVIDMPTLIRGQSIADGKLILGNTTLRNNILFPFKFSTQDGYVEFVGLSILDASTLEVISSMPIADRTGVTEIVNIPSGWN